MQLSLYRAIDWFYPEITERCVINYEERIYKFTTASDCANTRDIPSLI
jgi:hypothetical protein